MSLKRFKHVFMAGILSLTFLGAYWIGVETSEREEGFVVIDGLAVPVASLELGELWEQRDVPCRLPIRNRTRKAIHIAEFATSCGCASIAPRSLTIPAGQSALIDLKLDLTQRSFADLGAGRRSWALTITPFAATQGRNRLRRGWKLHATVNSRVTLDTHAVHFGESPVHNGPAASQRMVATAHVPCKGLEVRVDPHIATVSVSASRDERRFDITVTPNPALPPGDFKTEASVHVVTPEGHRNLACIMPVLGTMQPQVRLLPARVFLGANPVGETAQAVVTLQHSGVESQLAFDHVEGADDDFSVVPAQIKDISPGLAFRIEQKIRKEGSQAIEPRFVFRNKARNKPVTVPLEVSYHGVRNAPRLPKNRRGE